MWQLIRDIILLLLSDSIISVHFVVIDCLQDSNTALHIAAKLGNAESVRALLRGGANPHLANAVSETSLAMCATLCACIL